MTTHTEDQVRCHTAQQVNRLIDRDAENRAQRDAGERKEVLSRRIDELSQEWEMQRWLETNASALAFTGTILGLLVNKKLFAIPCLVLPFLFQHAIQGWCPPVPIFRRGDVRTRQEIDSEKYALKALRGDFRAKIHYSGLVAILTTCPTIFHPATKIVKGTGQKV